jgi:hypothetical protein
MRARDPQMVAPGRRNHLEILRLRLGLTRIYFPCRFQAQLRVKARLSRLVNSYH